MRTYGNTSRVECDQKNVAKCLEKLPKMTSQEKLKILTPLQNLPKNVGDLGILIVATGFEELRKVPIWSHWSSATKFIAQICRWAEAKSRKIYLILSDNMHE